MGLLLAIPAGYPPFFPENTMALCKWLTLAAFLVTGPLMAQQAAVSPSDDRSYALAHFEGSWQPVCSNEGPVRRLEGETHTWVVPQVPLGSAYFFSAPSPQPDRYALEVTTVSKCSEKPVVVSFIIRNLDFNGKSFLVEIPKKPGQPVALALKGKLGEAVRIPLEDGSGMEVKVRSISRETYPTAVETVDAYIQLLHHDY